MSGSNERESGTCIICGCLTYILIEDQGGKKGYYCDKHLETLEGQETSISDLESLWSGTEVENDLIIIEVPPNKDILDFIQEQKEDLPE